MNEFFRIVIPARIASQRLHEKMLADVYGRPLIVRTWQRAMQSGAEEVLVATDDERIATVLRAHGADVQMTGPHPTGTDRVAEAVRIRGWSNESIVVNVQGDEPLIAPADIQAAAKLLATSYAPMATLCVPLQHGERDRASVVKVVGGAGRAYWFSRAMMPGAYRHLGLYAWRGDGLRWFSQSPRSFYERVEMLEQLRVLEAGRPVALAKAPDGTSVAVDTAEDLERVREIIKEQS